MSSVLTTNVINIIIMIGIGVAGNYCISEICKTRKQYKYMYQHKEEIEDLIKTSIKNTDLKIQNCTDIVDFINKLSIQCADDWVHRLHDHDVYTYIYDKNLLTNFIFDILTERYDLYIEKAHSDVKELFKSDIDDICDIHNIEDNTAPLVNEQKKETVNIFDMIDNS